jgi:mono/diheme cytochrome c family protein
MSPTSFEDAIQICSGYCSVGRYLVRWELDAMLAYFWEHELLLSDLNLTPQEERQVRRALIPLSLDANQVSAARTLLTSKYLRAAGDTYRETPHLKPNPNGTITVGAYPNGETFLGDARRGLEVYSRACLHCHGTAVMPRSGPALVADVSDFYQILADGKVTPDQPYMPEFTLQRLSRQQSADIQAYLQQLEE